MKLIATLLCLLFAFSAFAEDKISGYISGGVIVINSDDKLIPDGEAKDVHFDTLSKIGAMITGEVNYKPDGHTRFHFGVPMQELSPKFELGVAREFDNKTKADFSIVLNPMEKTWQNPYIDRRHETDAESYGLELKLRRIAGTGFFTEMSVTKHNVSNDKAEDVYSSLGRNGYDSELKAGYAFPLKERMFADIFGKYVVGDRDGDAESFKSYGTGIKITAFTKDKNLLVFLLALDRVEFNSDNPYFNDTREETSYGAMALYRLNDAFGFKDKFISFSGGYGAREANIEFFDAESFFAGIGAGLNF
ncbi:DUF2860 family protein [Seleniivibrio sp.]|uniref:DUF2860 family protein n=1 Tax=Seleniivibrio sp. TaxID=2898801 RepID=UPI0025D6CC0A|nr:DUF2860 family protein [Seleniivibrio sp.]MCD8554118.1 DUF2860 domain-containing protein [Seleniivibrio sp.]